MDDQTIKSSPSKEFKAKKLELQPNGKYIKFERLTNLDILTCNHEHNTTNLRFKITKSECKLFKIFFSQHGFTETEENWNVMWVGGHVTAETLASLNRFQKVNHFPRTIEITRKDRMMKNITKMKASYGADHFDFIPETFALPSDAEVLQKEKQKQPNNNNEKSTIWIVKPINLSRGRGIHLVTDLHQVSKEDEPCVVSKYIQSPLLVDGFKFDLRLYILVTSFHPLTIYLYKEGLCRFATEQYQLTPETLSNSFMHLTNYSINKLSDKFVKNTNTSNCQSGSKWSLSALQKFLVEERHVDLDSLMSKIQDLIVKTILSIEDRVTPATASFVPHPGNCFELFGFDVLIDSELKPWLLEVNLSPSMATDAQIDLDIKSNLMADLYNMIGIEPVDCEMEAKSQKQDGLLRTQKVERTPEDVIQEEFDRKGAFECIYPTPDSHKYDKFFKKQQPLNDLLIDDVIKARRNSS